MAKLEAIDAKLAGMKPSKADNELKKHAKKCAGQQLRRPPLLPFHHVVFDPMHGIHNEINVLLDEAIHQHLMVEDPSVKATIEEAQDKINKEWKAAHLPKFIQFGQDKKGAHGHALNGPTFKAVMGRPSLLINSIKHMGPVYKLLETKKLTPKMTREATGVGADRGPKADAGKRGKGKAKAPAQKKAKQRTVTYADEVQSEDEEEEEPAAAAASGSTVNDTHHHPTN